MRELSLSIIFSFIFILSACKTTSRKVQNYERFINELDLSKINDFPITSHKKIDSSMVQVIWYCEGRSFIGFCGILLLYQYEDEGEFNMEKENIISSNKKIEKVEICGLDKSTEFIFNMSCLGEGIFYVPNLSVAFPEFKDYMSSEIVFYHKNHINGNFIKGNMRDEDVQTLSNGALIDYGNLIIGYWSIIK